MLNFRATFGLIYCDWFSYCFQLALLCVRDWFVLCSQIMVYSNAGLPGLLYDLLYGFDYATLQLALGMLSEMCLHVVRVASLGFRLIVGCHARWSRFVLRLKDWAHCFELSLFLFVVWWGKHLWE